MNSDRMTSVSNGLASSAVNTVLIPNRCTTPQRGLAMAVKSHEYIRDY